MDKPHQYLIMTNKDKLPIGAKKLTNKETVKNTNKRQKRKSAT